MKTDTIVIVGGGSAGWMTAATLITAFPNKKISLIESPDVPIVGVGESTLSTIRRWTRFIGLNEQDFFPETDASVKMSIKFTDFYKKDAGSFHYPFGWPMTVEDRNPFEDWHFKKYFYTETPNADFVNCLFPHSYLFDKNKFNPNLNGEFDNFNIDTDVAYHFDAVKFGAWLRDKVCIPKGVNHIVGTVDEILTDEDGISQLKLQNNDSVTADLFVDCTGFKSLLLGETLQVPFDSYSDMLPNNKAWATRVPYKNKTKELEGFTNCTAIDNGWCWNIPLWSRIGAGYVFSDKFTSEQDALKQFKQYLMSEKMPCPRSNDEIEDLEFRLIKMRVGIHKETFVKNVVGIGLAAGFIEPLESNGLFSVHEFLWKLIDILQRNEISQFDRDMYNINVRDTFDRFAKFVALHYALSHRDDTQYWKEINNKKFRDRFNDPDTQNVMRTDNFYDVIHRYMDLWKHPLGTPGITYIATGMNLNMSNKARIEDEEFHNKRNIKEEIDRINEIWNEDKQKWAEEADKSPTIEEYLRSTFYDRRN